jgi:hypothetical protein
MARKYKTSALTTTGTNPISVTTKKKSKSKSIWKAVGVAALGVAGLSALGGWGGGTGITLWDGLTKGWSRVSTGFSNLFGIGQTSSAATSAATSAAPILPISLGSSQGQALAGTAASALKASSATTAGSLMGTVGTGLKGIFNSITNMSPGGAFLWGSIFDTIGSALDTSGEDLIGLKEKELEARIAMHEDEMDLRHAALEAEAHAAQQDLEMRNRVAAQSGTFLGHSNPLTAGAEGVPSTGPGYTPKPPKTHPDFHPTGGLLS